MKTSWLLILAACGQPAPTALVFQSAVGVELRVAFTKLKYDDVPLGLGCQAIASPSTERGAILLCEDHPFSLRCDDVPKREHQKLSTRGRAFSVWCE